MKPAHLVLALSAVAAFGSAAVKAEECEFIPDKCGPGQYEAQLKNERCKCIDDSQLAQESAIDCYYIYESYQCEVYPRGKGFQFGWQASGSVWLPQPGMSGVPGQLASCADSPQVSWGTVSVAIRSPTGAVSPVSKPLMCRNEAGL